ncbi:hypothetical protein ACFRQM_44535 [Streptomyces sp. NPDC056831]|uniref:hypothetical protein n=1 Tax=Streptomyces sp. NPDC056831 TaxID=3345954 RepID=UPI0036CE9C3F
MPQQLGWSWGRDLFVVSRIDYETRRVRGLLDGLVREFEMQAMPAELRQNTVHEGEFGLEALAVFVCRSGLMPGADSGKRYRHAAWRRMQDHGDATTPRLPATRWHWHDLRHTYALAPVALPGNGPGQAHLGPRHDPETGPPRHPGSHRPQRGARRPRC